MASRKRYAAYIRSIKTLPDFGWTELNRWNRKPGKPVTFELNGFKAHYDYGYFVVEAPDGSIRKFDTYDPSLYRDMTDYAQKKED
jgi:hypothetical protein